MKDCSSCEKMKKLKIYDSDIIIALTRGYITKRNENKVLDWHLMEDMKNEILRLIKLKRRV